jgi:hypothetical protein
MWFIIRQTTAEYQPIYISGVPGMEEEEIGRELRNLARLQVIEKAAREFLETIEPNYDGTWFIDGRKHVALATALYTPK